MSPSTPISLVEVNFIKEKGLLILFEKKGFLQQATVLPKFLTLVMTKLSRCFPGRHDRHAGLHTTEN